MKISTALVFAGIISGAAFTSDAASFKVLKRQETSNRVYYTEVEMPNLVSSEGFDGKYFKIVEGKKKDPIAFNEQNEELLLKAATVYYHLNAARDFWVERMKSESAANLSKITVRIEIKNQFDELGHFAHDNRAPQYNNALSIPAGQTPSWVPADRQDKWGKEIWFRPMKQIPSSELPPAGPNPLTSGLMALERPLINYFQNDFNNQLVEHFFYPAYAARPVYQDVIRYVGTFALMKVIVAGSRYADPLFMEKFYYLDTAMVPEIVYHEYAHIVLSDHLEMSHSTPMNEGMADYFAAVQSNRRKVYAKVPGRSNSAPKDTENKRPYSHWDESNRNATADFTLSVLWDVRETLGAAIGDKVVYHARTFLKTEESTVSDDLLRAILRSCEVQCDSPRRDKLKLYQAFTKKGF